MKIQLGFEEPKFKIGDKVEILKEISEDYGQTGEIIAIQYCCLELKDKKFISTENVYLFSTNGQVDIDEEIKKCCERHNIDHVNYYIKLDLSNVYYSVHESDLRKISKKSEYSKYSYFLKEGCIVEKNDKKYIVTEIIKETHGFQGLMSDQASSYIVTSYKLEPFKWDGETLIIEHGERFNVIDKKEKVFI